MNITSLDVVKITALTLTLLSLLISCEFSFGIVGFRMFSFHNFAFKSPKIISYSNSIISAMVPQKKSLLVKH